MLNALLPDAHDIPPISRTNFSSFGFSTEDLPKALQFAAWQDLMAPVADLRQLLDPDDGFEAEEITWDLESIALTRSNTPTISFVHTAAHLRADPIDHWIVSCARSGAGRTVGSGRVSETRPGVATIKSLRAPFQGTLSDTVAVHLFVPRDFCRGAAAALDAADNTSLTTGLGRLLADYLLDLDRRLPMLTIDELPGVLTATRAMLTACVVPSADNLAEAQKPIDATLLERARLIIQRDLHSPELGSDDLCRELGVSRSRLYRLFEPLGGVVHYIRLRRLLDVHAALSNPNDNRRIVYIAAERGFHDAAEFSRAFKREFGYRPTDARNNTVHLPTRQEVDHESGDGRAGFYNVLRKLH